MTPRAEFAVLERIDWRAVVVNLRAAGFSAAQIGAAVGLCESSVYQMARDRIRRPADWLTCLRLLDLHHDRCPERHSLEGIAS